MKDLKWRTPAGLENAPLLLTSGYARLCIRFNLSPHARPFTLPWTGYLPDASSAPFSGAPGPSEMLIDFQEVKRVVSPLIDAWDHCTYVNRDDEALRSALATLGVKHYLLDGRSTTEALAKYVARFLCTHGFDMLHEHGVTAIQVRVQETETCYATTRATVSDHANAPAPNLEEALVEPEAVAG